jgi:hypothetical protein
MNTKNNLKNKKLVKKGFFTCGNIPHSFIPPKFNFCPTFSGFLNLHVKLRGKGSGLNKKEEWMSRDINVLSFQML